MGRPAFCPTDAATDESSGPPAWPGSAPALSAASVARALDEFAYTEQVTVSHVGKPFLAYAQRTWSIDDGRPLHAETGYWRCGPDGAVELVIAHPTGHVEVAQGTIAGPGTVIDLRSTVVAGTASAKAVTELRRRFVVDGDRLRYELDMAAVGVALAPHLRGELVQSPGDRRS